MQEGSYPSQLNLGAYVPTTTVWDISEIYRLQGISEPLKELLVRLYQNLNNMSVLLNLKETGYYPNQETINSQLYFPNPTLNNAVNTPTYRNVFRMTVDFGALPNTTTKSVAHNIAIMPGYTFTRIFGAATNSSYTSFIPLPYPSLTSTDIIELYADSTNVYIATAADYSSYTTTTLVLEYLKQ